MMPQQSDQNDDRNWNADQPKEHTSSQAHDRYSSGFVGVAPMKVQRSSMQDVPLAMPRNDETFGGGDDEV
jgi:hypothetical protein